jgi:DNA-binding CsgD family transcriptional regulator
LTTREREVAGFAARGLSDVEIADRLSLSRRTVETHLYRAYAKLGVSGRHELAPLFPGPTA